MAGLENNIKVEKSEDIKLENQENKISKYIPAKPKNQEFILQNEKKESDSALCKMEYLLSEPKNQKNFIKIGNKNINIDSPNMDEISKLFGTNDNYYYEKALPFSLIGGKPIKPELKQFAEKYLIPKPKTEISHTDNAINFFRRIIQDSIDTVTDDKGGRLSTNNFQDRFTGKTSAYEVHQDGTVLFYPGKTDLLGNQKPNIPRVLKFQINTKNEDIPVLEKTIEIAGTQRVLNCFETGDVNIKKSNELIKNFNDAIKIAKINQILMNNQTIKFDISAGTDLQRIDESKVQNLIDGYEKIKNNIVSILGKKGSNLINEVEKKAKVIPSNKIDITGLTGANPEKMEMGQKILLQSRALNGISEFLSQNQGTGTPIIPLDKIEFEIGNISQGDGNYDNIDQIDQSKPDENMRFLEIKYSQN